MSIARLLKYCLLIGSAGCFTATAVLGFWPTVLNSTRIPLFVAETGAWCILASICYVAFKFLCIGLRLGPGATDYISYPSSGCPTGGSQKNQT